MIHLNAYKATISYILAQGMTIDDELKALMLVSGLQLSWKTFTTIVCNVSTTFYSKKLGEKCLFKIQQTMLPWCKAEMTERIIAE